MRRCIERRMCPASARYFWAIFVMATITALLTAFYTFRAYFMTFWGEERFPEEAGHHPHDAPPVMAWPLRILAVCALLIGGVVGPTGYFGGYLHHTSGFPHAEEHGLDWFVIFISVDAVLLGVGLAWVMYVWSPSLPARLANGDSAVVYGVSQQVLFRRDFLGDPRGAAARVGLVFELV